MGILNKLINVGVNNIEESDIADKIRISNIAALLLAVVAGAYIFITYYFVKPITYIPILGVIISLTVLVFNKIGVNKAGRLLISVAPVTLPAIYHAYLIPASDSSQVPLALVTFAFSLVPFVVFQMKEYWGWVPSFTYCAVWLIGFDDLKNALETEEILDATFLKEGVFLYLTGFMAVFFGSSCIYALSYVNSLNVGRTKKLMEEMDHSQKEMKQSQDELQKTLEEIEIKKLEEEKRMWANDGMVKFTEILRNFTGEDLYAEIISELVNYVGAKQGKVFRTIEQDGEQFLKLEGTYAYDRFKFEVGTDGIIKKGDGLIGEAFQEGEIVHLTEIPDGYTTITSGLGEANPKAIIIVPLMNEEIIEGVIELAGFHEFEEFQIEFLSKVGINIATTFAREKINTKTALLLEESQQQAEMMQQQEEEMRQNMEEMQATQDMMDAKEKELLDEINKLKAMLQQ